jgi:hypothetical protein
MISEKVAVLLWCAGGLLAVVSLLFSIKTIRYRIGSKFLIITWLGIPLRWIRLTNIAHVTPERFAWAERWFNAFRVRHRVLTVHRRHGLVRRISISPPNRFVFRAELNRAREQAGGSRHRSVHHPRSEMVAAFQNSHLSNR